MKQLLLLVMMLAAPSYAQDATSLDWGGIGAFLTDVAKQSHAGLGWNLAAQPEKTLYVPLRTFHSQDGSVNYAQIAGGAGLLPDKHGEPLAGILINGPAISNRLWSKWSWAQTHSTGIKLPELWLGPLVKAPMPGHPFTWKGSVLGMIAIGLPLGK